MSRNLIKSRSSSDADDPPHLDTSHQQEALELAKTKEQGGIEPDQVIVCMGRDTSDLDFATPIPMGWIGLDAEKAKNKIEPKNLEQLKLQTIDIGDGVTKPVSTDMHDIGSPASSPKSWTSTEQDKCAPDHEDPADAMVHNRCEP